MDLDTLAQNKNAWRLLVGTDFEQCEKSCPFVSQHKMEGKLAVLDEIITDCKQMDVVSLSYIRRLKSQLSEVKKE
jgi:hypothetical protein